MKLFNNWNFGKHFAFVMTFYGLVAALCNVVLFLAGSKKIYKEIESAGRWAKHISPEEKRRAAVQSYFQEPPKSAKVANGIIGVCCAADLAAYPLVKKLSEKL